jgi:hypothetical protein
VVSLGGPGGGADVDLAGDQAEFEKRIGDGLLAGENLRREFIDAVFLPGEPYFEGRLLQADAWSIWDPFYAGAQAAGAQVLTDGTALITPIAAFSAAGCCFEKSAVEE